MVITDMFDAAREGNFEAFVKYFTGDVNSINQFSDFNCLQLAVTRNFNVADRLNIMRFLIEKGIDLNYKDKKVKRNALHVLYFHFLKGDLNFLQEATKLLIQAGVDVNAFDKFNAIPLKYAITISKLSTDKMIGIYDMLIRAGSDYSATDTFGKSCIDYAREYSWRRGFLDLVGGGN